MALLGQLGCRAFPPGWHAKAICRLLAAAGRIGQELAAALKAEARRRVEAHSFFGHVAYASLTARNPG